MSKAPSPFSLSPEELVNSYRTFGPFGPVYQVKKVLRKLESDAELQLLVLETGEEVQALFSNVFRDPEAV